MAGDGPGTPTDVCEDDFSWGKNDNDGAYLHFDPSIETHNQPTIFPNIIIPPEGHNSPPVLSSAAPMTPRKYTSSRESPTNKLAITKKTKGIHRKGEGDEPSNQALGDNWELKIRSMIIEDNILHQRILRYEPIHFDVFFQLATEQDLPSRGLRIKLRSLLDKLAINFYGADTVGTRR